MHHHDNSIALSLHTRHIDDSEAQRRTLLTSTMRSPVQTAHLPSSVADRPLLLLPPWAVKATTTGQDWSDSGGACGAWGACAKPRAWT